MTPEWRGLIRRCVIEFLGAFLVTWGISALIGAHFSVFGVAGLVIVLIVAFNVRQRVREPVSNPPPPEPEQQRGDPFERFEALRERLRWGVGSSDYFDLAVRPVIVELVDDRLIRKHGVHRATHPAQARALVDDTVWAFITGHSGDKPPRLEDVTTVIEKVAAL